MWNRFIPLLLLLALSCRTDGPEGPQTDDFDRKAMLVYWADKIIVPAYQEMDLLSAELESQSQNFLANPIQLNLLALRLAWESAYLQWQKLSMFELGKAEEVLLRDHLNIYPVDASGLEKNIQTGDYNLALPSQRDRQGFPALDYLLYGLGENDAEILDAFTNDSLALSRRQYVSDISQRIHELISLVLQDWKDGYRDNFVKNSGNNANASVDQLVNAYLLYYEKYLRAGKVGIPAGVFSGGPLPTHVEAPYKADLNKSLLLASLDAVQDFFNGKTSIETGPSLSTYLDYLEAEKADIPLSERINEQFNAARNSILPLEDSLATQLDQDESAMLAAYDQLQLNVILLKVDMLQALNINVTYVDADGD